MNQLYSGSLFSSMSLVVSPVITTHFWLFACHLIPSALSFSNVILGVNVTEKKKSQVTRYPLTSVCNPQRLAALASHPHAQVSEWFNGTVFVERPWPEAEKWLLVAVLGLEMVMGIVGNGLVLLVKVMCRGQFCCRYWLPFLSLTVSDFGCSLLIISGSLLAMLTGGQRSPWCEVVSLLKFAFISSSIGSIAILCVQRVIGVVSTGSPRFVVMVTACLASWVTGVVFGSVPVVYAWIKYDPAEMLCAVFWESSYSDMLVYILCAFSICIFLPFLLILICSLLSAFGCRSSCISDDEADLSAVTPLLVASYMLCYTPFVVSELILLGRMDLSPAPDWLRTLSSVMSYLDCSLNPLIYCSHQDFREAGLALLWTNRKPSSDPVLTAITKRDL